MQIMGLNRTSTRHFANLICVLRDFELKNIYLLQAATTQNQEPKQSNENTPRMEIRHMDLGFSQPLPKCQLGSPILES